jgi:PKD repeat protein
MPARTSSLRRLAEAVIRRRAPRLVALALVVLAGTPGTAAALDQWGPLGMIDGRDGSLNQLAGVAVAPDGSAIYAVEQRAQTTDDCGNTYRPIVVHRYALSPDRSSATETGQVTFAADPPIPYSPDVPVTVATGAGGRSLLLIGLNSDHDANGDGTCTPVTDPSVLTELDATTLAPVRTLDAAALGGYDVERLAASGDGSARVWALGRKSPPPGSYFPTTSLLRFDGVPGEVAPAATFPLAGGVLPSTQCYPSPGGTQAWLAAEPSGAAILQLGIGWNGCINMVTPVGEVLRVGSDGTAQQPPVATFYPDPSGIPLPNDPNFFLYSVGTPLAVDPATGDLFLGQYANRDAGLQERRSSDGTLVRAWGPQGPPVHLGDTTGPACAFSYRESFWLAAAPGLVVAASPQAFDPTAAPGTVGPIISWFGARNPVPRCLLTPPPTASLTVTPASGATVGSQVTLDASASSADHSRPIDADNSLTYRFESDGSGYGPPTTNPVYQVPITRPGTYTLGVLVTDGYGQEAEVRRDYTVPAPAPVAVLSVSDLRPAVGETVTLDGSRSTGNPTHFQFDLDGSGTFATDQLSQPVVTHRFTQPGEVTVGLRVSNASGVQATTTVAVDVQPVVGPLPVTTPTGGLAPALGGELAFPSATVVSPAPSVRLVAAGAPDRAGRLPVRLDCGIGGADCAGSVWLGDRGGRRISATVRFHVPAGQTARVRLLLDRHAESALRQTAALRGTLLATLIAPDGAVVRKRAGVLVRVPRRAVRTRRSGR